jgi:hypothetical protein
VKISILLRSLCSLAAVVQEKKKGAIAKCGVTLNLTVGERSLYRREDCGRLYDKFSCSCVFMLKCNSNVPDTVEIWDCSSPDP